MPLIIAAVAFAAAAGVALVMYGLVGRERVVATTATRNTRVTYRTLADVRERRSWDEYQHAYSEMLSHTSTEWAPWHVIPADHKWFARLAAAASVLDALERLRPRYPRRVSIPKAELERARAELEAE